MEAIQLKQVQAALPGTWSDDSSMTFCLAESLSKGYDLQHKPIPSRIGL